MGTYTTNYNLFLPTIGEQGWGELVNGNFETIDTVMNGLDTKVGTLETDMDAIEERVGTLEGKVSNVENVVSDNKIICSSITNGIPIFEQDSFSHTLTSPNANNVSANIDIPTLYDSIFNIIGTISIAVTQKLSSSSGKSTLRTYLYDADGNALFSYSNSSVANGSTITHEMNIPLNKKLHLNVQFDPFNSESNVVTTIGAYSVSI